MCACNFVCHNSGWRSSSRFVVPDPAGRDDQTGRALEVMGVELADGTLYVIHVMDMRAKYRSAYEEGTP